MKDKLVLAALLACVPALLLLLWPGPVRAEDGTITGLDLSPSPAAPNQDVTVTVQGALKCKKLDVSFGDQSPPVTLDNPDFENQSQADNSVTHAYATAGSYTVTATPVEQCAGGAQKTLTVGDAGGAGAGGGGGPGAPQTLGSAQDHLCTILENCPVGPARSKMMIRLNPVIESMFLGPIKPGAGVMLYGRHFGRHNEPELKLHLKTDHLTIDVPVFEWSKSMVAGLIPSSLSGVHDQPAEFEVIREDNRPSNRYDVTFTAIHEVRQLEQDEVRIVQCPSTSNCDRCNAVRHEGCAVQSAYEDATMVGSHSNCMLCVGDDTGTDIYEVDLKNGWVIEDYDQTGYLDPTEATLSIPQSAPLGASHWKPKVKWSASSASGLHYWIRIYIEGPRGLPYK